MPWTAEQKQRFVRMQYEAQKNHYAAQHATPAMRLFALKVMPPAACIWTERAEPTFLI